MKNLAILFFCLAFYQFTFAQAIGVGTQTPDPSAMLDVSSTNKGMLVPRLTTAQRTTISSPATGLLVFDTNTNSFWFKGGATWVELIDSTSTLVHANGPDIYMATTGNVGIGDSNPMNKLDLQEEARNLTHPSGLPLYVTGNLGDASDGVEIRNSDATQGIGIGKNTIYAAGSNTSQDLGLQAKGASGNLLLKTNSTERIRVTSNGNVGVGTNAPLQKLHVQGKTYISDSLGIGHSNPRASLHLKNEFGNRRIILWESVANDEDQFYGFGINGGTLRYQVSNPNDNHIFFAGTSGTSNELMRIKGNGRVGIGIPNPLGTLDIMRGTATEGTLLIRGTTHNSRFNNSTSEDTYIRGGKAGSHVFINDASGLGNVGIGFAAPVNKVDIQGGAARSGSHAINRPLYVTGNIGSGEDGIEFRHDNGSQGIGFGYNTIYAASSSADQNLGLKAKGATGALLFTTNGAERMRVTGNGNVGIGTNAPAQKLHIIGSTVISDKLGIDVNVPKAPLHLKSNGVQLRKLILDDAGNDNDHQFFGFGIGAGELRYQVNNPADHVFYAGNDAVDNDELMRIKGTGNIGIGTQFPAHKLSVNGNTGINGNLAIGNGVAANAPLQFENTLENRKIVLYEIADNDHQFYGLGINGSTVRYQVSSTSDNHVFYAGTSATTSDTLMHIKGNGNVDVAGTVEMGWVTVWSEYTNIDQVQAKFVDCFCPPGTTVIGGGGETDALWTVFLTDSYASTPTSWRVQYYNSDLFTTAQIKAFAICARMGN